MNNSNSFGQKIVNDANGRPIYAKTHGQNELIKAIDTHDIIFVNGPAGTGKAQPLDSNILTPSGWKLMGDISIGDNVISVDGTATKVLAVYPQGTKDIYKVTFDDNSSTECCKEHLWEVCNEYERGDKRPAKVRSLETIMKRIKGHDGRKNYSIPMVSAVKFEAQSVKFDAYALGILLGDGHFNEHFININTVDTEIHDSVLESVDKLGLKLNPIKSDKCGYKICDVNGGKGMYRANPLLEYTKELGIYNTRSHTKFIPDVYKFNTIEIRTAVLQGLMDSDGTVSKNGMNSTYTSTSKKLADDVKFLVESLGGKVTMATRRKKYTYKGEKLTGKLSYRVTIKLPESIIPFRLSRKVNRYIPKTKYTPTRYITGVEFVGTKEAQCIKVDHPRHLYITDDFIVTHNTFLAVCKAVVGLDRNTYDRLVLTRPAVESGEELGFLPGSLDDKIGPYMRPLYDSIEKLKKKKKVKTVHDDNGQWQQQQQRGKDSRKKNKVVPETHQKEETKEDEWMEKVEIAPLAYMRGATMDKSFVILDEAQNVTPAQMKMFLTRMGQGSKVVITGDASQTDLDSRIGSGFRHAQRLLAGVEGIGFVHLDERDIVRHRLVKEIILKYEKEDSYKYKVEGNKGPSALFEDTHSVPFDEYIDADDDESDGTSED